MQSQSLQTYKRQVARADESFVVVNDPDRPTISMECFSLAIVVVACSGV